MKTLLRTLAPLALLGFAACGGGLRAFPNAEPMKVDDDRQAFGPIPDEYFSGLIWDGADQSLFRPLSWFFAVDPGGEAVNVNAVDEVPNSAWFENRMGARALTLEEIVEGPCAGKPPLDTSGPWTVVGAKPNGENPGFIIKAQDGRRYLLKFDGLKQQPRATAADVIGTRVYWAAGYHTPCNTIYHFDRKILTISPKAKAENEEGEKVPLAEHHLDKIFEKAMQRPDGTYRTNASLFLEGRPLGPWKYSGTRDDDANDVVDHEDRREIRAASVLASWLNHFDSREQNTLDMWVETDKGRGYIKHHYIDWGDCFGSLWEWDSLSRRWGHAYLLDYEDIGLDFITLGLISQPWDRVEYGPAGEVWGYFRIDPFDPADWHNEYPNPAFSRLTEHDAAWMARIMVDFTDEVVDALVDKGIIYDELARSELKRILKGRRDKVLRRWFSRLSPLGRAQLAKTEASTSLCLTDLAVRGGVADPAKRRYSAQAWTGLELRRVPSISVDRASDDRVCVQVPMVPKTSRESPSYVVIDVVIDAPDEDGDPMRFPPLRAHLYQNGDNTFRLVGIERPDDDDPPGD